MYQTCVFCHAPLGANTLLETFPVGRRLAFDEARGRLWVVCGSCERWNLTPLEERWEAVEDCERLFRESRRRVATEHVGLARTAEGTELIRIGTPPRTEFAAWRYGDQFGRRRRRSVLLGAGAVAGGAVMTAGAIGLGALIFAAGAATAGLTHSAVRRRRQQRVIARCHTEEGGLLTVLREHLPSAELVPNPSASGGWGVRLAHTGGTTTIAGAHALAAVGLVMPAINGTGGTAALVERATRRLEGFADATDYLRSAAAMSAHISRPGPDAALTRLPVDVRLAIEMAANEENERFAFEGELWLLEEAWRQAEEIAAIADSLVLPEEIEAALARLRHISLDQ